MDFCVNPSKFSFPGRLILLSSSPNLLINLPDRNKQNPQRKYTLYLWPRSKVWIRAGKRAFKPPRLKSQMLVYDSPGFVCCYSQIEASTLSIAASITLSSSSSSASGISVAASSSEISSTRSPKDSLYFLLHTT